MLDYGPTSAFNTERYVFVSFAYMDNNYFCQLSHVRCETYNSLIRARNVYGNRLAPSRDIAHGFALIEHLRFICAVGSFDGTKW